MFFVLFLFLFFFWFALFCFFPLFCFVFLFCLFRLGRCLRWTNGWYCVWKFHYTLNMTQYTLQSPFIILVCPAKVLIFRCPLSASFDLKLFHSLKSATVQVYYLIYCVAFLVFTNSLGNVCLFYVLPWERGEEQNREEGEMAQTKLGGGRNRGEK